MCESRAGGEWISKGKSASWPHLQPELDQTADDFGFCRDVWLSAARAKHPFGTNYLHQSFVRAKSPLYSISRPRLPSSMCHFAVTPRELYVGESPSAFRL
jgi:hypothetical protein